MDMEHSSAPYLLQQGLLAGAFIAVPLLSVSAIIGLFFAVVQATMQIQDSSLQQAVKIIVAIGLLYLLGHTLAFPLLTFTRQLFESGL